MSDVLMIVGPLLGLIGWVWLVVAGFVENILWGVGIILFSPLCVVFSLLHWPEYKVPTIFYLFGIVLYLLGAVMR